MSELAQTLSIPEGQTLKDLVQEYERQLLLMALELLDQFLEGLTFGD